HGVLYQPHGAVEHVVEDDDVAVDAEGQLRVTGALVEDARGWLLITALGLVTGLCPGPGGVAAAGHDNGLGGPTGLIDPRDVNLTAAQRDAEAGVAGGNDDIVAGF